MRLESDEKTKLSEVIISVSLNGKLKCQLHNFVVITGLLNRFSLFSPLQEHIQEVLDKWTQIDDEIWAKIIVFERNRRVAKAYARVPVLTVNGSDDGFDGMR
jgi:hypothetical protein